MGKFREGAKVESERARIDRLQEKRVWQKTGRKGQEKHEEE